MLQLLLRYNHPLQGCHRTTSIVQGGDHQLSQSDPSLDQFAKLDQPLFVEGEKELDLEFCCMYPLIICRSCITHHNAASLRKIMAHLLIDR